MAHHKSAKKRIRTSEKRRLYTRSVKSRVRTFSRYFEESAASAENKEEALAKLNAAISEIQKAASKGVLHKNTAARKVGRLARKFNKSFAK